MKRAIVGILALMTTGMLWAGPADFSQENAYAILKTLAGEIGPRPMGSPAERRALDFAVEKFKEYGCQESYVMPFTVAEGVNTNSGIAVGVLKGKTSRLVVIGGHIDSAGPDIPGADDDGSGAASVIELARVLGKRQNESTVLFCCWGGEEEGLRGSTYFVKHFAQIDSVCLMLQIDMADGSGVLEADPDGSYQTSAPRWLTRAAFDIFYNDLNYSGLVYPTQSATINGSFTGATGSDHDPFLEAGIPAIDFTSDVTFPIHSPLDNLQNFNPSGLKRSGDLVLKLFERFDGGVPSRTTEKYWMIVIGNTPVFVSHWMIWVFGVIALAVTVVAVLAVRRKREVVDKALKVRWSALKLLLFTLFIQLLIWSSEGVVGTLRGLRYPWVNNFAGFEVLAALFGLLGLWILLQSVQRWRLSTDPSVYFYKSILLLFAFEVVFTFMSIEVTIYAAAAMLFVSLAMLVRPPVAKLVLFLLAAYIFSRLIFIEWLGLFQRGLANRGSDFFFVGLLFNATLIGLFTLISLPFVYAFAAVYRDAKVDLLWLKSFSRRFGGVAVVVLIAGMTLYLTSRPVYDHLWRRQVSVQQRYTAGADSSSVSISSGEYLRGLNLRYDGVDTVLHEKSKVFALSRPDLGAVTWSKFNSFTEREPAASPDDTVASVRRVVELHSTLRPLTVTITYRGSQPLVLSSPWAIGGRRRIEKESPKVKAFSWYAFPDTQLVVPVTFTMRDSDKVTETIEVVYDTLAYPLSLNRDLTYFTKRTVVTRVDSFSVPRTTDRLAVK